MGKKTHYIKLWQTLLVETTHTAKINMIDMVILLWWTTEHVLTKYF